VTSDALSRRGLLKGMGAGVAASALPGSAQTLEAARLLPLAELKGITPRISQPTDRVALLLRRVTFGVRPEELDRARRMGIAAWLDEQLHPETIDDSVTDAQVAALFPTLGKSAQELFDLAEQADDGGYSVAMELKRATLYRALYSKRQVFEVMVEFWNNHFSMYHFKDDVAVLKTVDDRAVARQFAFGRFGDVLRASAHSPAMMVYLDNADNVADGPNENYARELMELHTVGVDAGYTQADVHEVARCFTGWTVDYNGEGTDGSFLFDPDSHDFGPKTVLGVPIAGGDPGMLDGERVLTILASHPSCARFICTKLCRHFVADTPPPSLVDKAAATFTATQGDIRAVLRTILISNEFFQSAGQKVRRPFEFHVAALRVLRAGVGTADGLDNLIWPLYAMGQVPFEWEPPNGYPDVGAAWANTNGLLSRWNFAAALVLGWFDGVSVPVRLAGLTGAKTPAQYVDAVAALLLQRGIDEPDRSRLIDYVAQGRPANGAVPAWYLNQQTQGLLALILGSPYFQLR
jgi:uncharacterized protein (DUF1800 family)